MKDVLAGEAGWPEEDIESFTARLAAKAPLRERLTVNFQRIDAAIRASPLWTSPLIPGY